MTPLMKHALAIFAKTPVAGKVKTRLTPPLSPEQSAELYRCMLLDTVARMSALQFDTFLFYDGEPEFFHAASPHLQLIRQTDASLGRRLEDAFTVLADLGYQARVVIGSDAPDLPLAFVRQAFDQLLDGRDAVFGPAEDGGYYLVGIRGEYGALFRDIPWSGPQVLVKSLATAERDGLDCALLPAWYDVDSAEDLQRPGLCDPFNGAPLTRDFLRNLGIATSETTVASCSPCS
ncbi:TIGR04282 family arsenosugar biosynthesis glycosyltransferase [Geomonas sp.]|uniref:TIGR04282 family arsenosugar biosynthesis glycosyltransferase n=1 Tax=Geomonas sp. TaxID=2651584 RepID=UPI002B49503C|nr:TIGR04282 family arsenosugar biosynthesis glycosyltransferase [Geomonas sp.]HJV33935.1 TIGR04282 family arsenosugar biosynthesis glycosyltransferase [Geomonas sp.]